MPGPWENADGEIIEESGAPVECDDCPCDPCAEYLDEYSLDYLEFKTEKYSDAACTSLIGTIYGRINPTSMPLPLERQASPTLPTPETSWPSNVQCVWYGNGQPLQSKIDSGSWNFGPGSYDIRIFLADGGFHLANHAQYLGVLSGPVVTNEVLVFRSCVSFFGQWWTSEVEVTIS